MKKINSPFNSLKFGTLTKHWQFLLYLIGAVFLRIWNFQNSLYFIYDQGRDALVFEKMAQGKLVLVGPTSGLAGFFLGPLWYYVGLPGYLLGRGNPYGICLWYIFVSCLALPLFWYVAHKLFPQHRIFALFTAIALAVIPGSIRASLMIWNPLLSVPLMTAALISFWKARESRLWLGVGFFCLALTLQSEFAYAIFYLIPLFLLIPWIRQKFNLKDFAVAIGAIAITSPPQLFFEIRHRFLMTTSLIHSLGDKTTSLPWSDLFSRRPDQLKMTTQEILYGMSNRAEYLFPLTIVLVLLGIVVIVWKWKKDWSKTRTGQVTQTDFLWQLIAIFAIIPYPFYLIWRGNFGNFFWYYLTCHFIFLIPLMMKGLAVIVQIPSLPALKEKWIVPSKIIVWAFTVFMIISMGAISADYWYAIIFKAAETNNAGLGKIVAATEQIYKWAEADQQNPPTVRVFTSNILTEQYDYTLNWYAHSHYFPTANTVGTGAEKRWYIMVESKAAAAPIFFTPWYTAATKGGHQVREQQVGVLTLETWERD